MTSVVRTAELLERLARIVQNEAHVEGLKPTQWEALRFLARANRFSRTPTGLTAYLGMTKGTVSQTLNALERKNLIEKRSDPADRRQIGVDVTRSGRDMLTQDPLDAILRSLSKLPAEDQSGLEKGLETLLRETLKRRGGRSFGICGSCRHFRRDAVNGEPHRCVLLDEPLSNSDSRRICIEQET